MLNKLKGIEARYQEVQELLADPAVYADPEQLRRLSREQKELEPVVAAFRAYTRAERNLEEARELLNDPDLKEAAQEHEELRAALDAWGIYEEAKTGIFDLKG